mmetsp:Transcript_7693/g.28338  ORF Transcript_7693/g.28338 Transcript_7693/m.28338 type:complete len:239 (-) Transcript_7693:1770-2486(-)
MAKPSPPLGAAVESLVLPGQSVLSLPEDPQAVVRIGGGVRQEGERIVSTRAGTLQQTAGGKLWVQSRVKRYVPQSEDLVVGVVVDKGAEHYIIDVGAASKGLLPVLAFENASRRNRPHLNIGDAVYMRVTSANRDIDPTFSCVNALSKANGMGPLKGGYIFSGSSSLCRSLLASPPCAVLQALGKSLTYEIAIGMNGQIWVKAGKLKDTILISNAILNSEFLTDDQVDSLVKKLLRSR